MELTAFDKVIVVEPFRRFNGWVIGIKPESDGSTTFIVEPLRVDFTPHKTGSRLMRINSKEIENNTVTIEKHEI